MRRKSQRVVVGIGGSAGGLQAFSELLGHLPSDTGMAFVIVSHLDPQHPSMLAHLLAAKTTMTVGEAVDSARPLANHVYVQPPTADLTMSDGRLRLTPRTGEERHLPIDSFMRSLAETQGERAIGVILSGAASDGALGMTAVKSAGGVTFAQEPGSAEYPSMPSRAIATGAVDFVLAPAQIAAELASLSGHAYLGGTRKGATALFGEHVESEALDEVFALLRDAMGVDFSSYKRPTIRRRVARRMLLHRCDELGAYVGYLREHPTEVENLYHDLLITVTEFFRDPETFAILRAQVLPEILRRQTDGSAVRLWVPGCATGEEAYSLAISALDAMADLGIRRSLKIFATDINERDLAKARCGLYPENVVGPLGAERLRQYFVRAESGYRVSKMVRDLCVFARHDLARDPPFPRLDLVSCRNVLIYMGPALQRRVVSLLHYSLLPGGCLVLGQAESLGGLGRLFDAVDRKHKIFAKRAVPSPVARYALASDSVDEHLAAPLDRLRERGHGDDAERAVLSEFVPPGVTVDANLEIVRFRGETAPFLRNPSGRPTQRVLDLIAPELREELRAALKEAGTRGVEAIRPGLHLSDATGLLEVDLHVVPFESKAGAINYAVLFADVGRRRVDQIKPKAGRRVSPDETDRLRRELRATRERLEALVQEQEAANEELRAANEEILSGSEEMQSVNEELEASSEELQSTNEELESRNMELWRYSDDLNNLLMSVRLPIIMVGRDLRVRRSTPEAEHLFKVTASDLGRPIGDIAARIGMADLEGMASKAIDGVTPLERAVQDDSGRWYAAQVRPYQTAEHRIDGAVLTLNDVDELTRRYDAQLHIATTLQEGFLHQLPSIEGLELAAFSAPAARPELIGGDFHDAFRLPDGLVVLLIGDVAGKGIRAARLTEEVRIAVRTSALASSSPDIILDHVNRLLLSIDTIGQYVTAYIGVLDPRSGRLSVASAGHPAAVRLSELACTLLEPEYGLPLGVHDAAYQQRLFRLAQGEVLVLYTDGVTEARRDGELFGEERLVEVLCGAQDRHPQVLVDRLHDAVTAHAGELTDDLQILALRLATDSG